MYRDDSHIRRIENNLFNNSIDEGKAHLNSLSGTTADRLDHFITSIVEEDRPDIVMIHVGSNYITRNTISNIDANGISKRVTDIGKKCFLHGVKEMTTSSILTKRQFKLMRIIR